jgi:NAD(P)-dependent dehydrogenase (short-subunit alcohol dehydrogenase family)
MTMSTKPLANKNALVTGASRGIGAAIARKLADDGANVAISYVASADKAEALVKELEGKGVKAKAFKADQADRAQVDKLVKDAAKHFGSLDILVNNAGLPSMPPRRS